MLLCHRTSKFSPASQTDLRNVKLCITWNVLVSSVGITLVIEKDRWIQFEGRKRKFFSRLRNLLFYYLNRWQLDVEQVAKMPEFHNRSVKKKFKEFRTHFRNFFLFIWFRTLKWHSIRFWKILTYQKMHKESLNTNTCQLIASTWVSLDTQELQTHIGTQCWRQKVNGRSLGKMSLRSFGAQLNKIHFLRPRKIVEIKASLIAHLVKPRIEFLFAISKFVLKLIVNSPPENLNAYCRRLSAHANGDSRCVENINSRVS